MGIMTLGDLTETSEQELLASKNFGETSLVEIREMLVSKGLELGQFANQKRMDEPLYDPDAMSRRRTGDARSPDLGPQPVGPGPQVHGAVGPHHHRRTCAPHRR